MFELRPEYLNMPAREASGVSKKDTILAAALPSITAPWGVGEGFRLPGRAPRGITNGVVTSLAVG